MAGYHELTRHKLDRRMPIDQVTFLVIDAETTGFDLQKDRMLSLAALTLKAGRMELAAMKSWLIFQQKSTQHAAVAVHGILPGETATGDPEMQVVTALLELMAGAVVVGHHVQFDLAMLGAAIKRAGGPALRQPYVDTAKLAQHALDAFARTGYPGQKDPSLDEVCVHLGLETLDRHTAEGDTFTTATLFLSLLSHLKRRKGGPLTLADIPLSYT
ncbi:MAG: 3'-5' exonuclease [Opitutaceae bacterium]|nr:3'-5' exonuclease [Opitutaceae bacterium]